MIVPRKLAILLVIGGVILAPAMGGEDKIEDLKSAAAAQAMELMELQELYRELAAKISGATDGNEDVMDSISGLSQRLEELDFAIDQLGTLMEGADASESDRLSDLREDVEILISQNALLSEKIERLREAASTRPAVPLAQGEAEADAQTAADPISRGINGIASLLMILSEEMRGSLLDVSSAIGGGLGTLARLDEGGNHPEILPGPGLVMTVLVMLLVVALVSIMAQGYYREGFEGNFAILARVGELLRPNGEAEGEEEIISSVREPFWDVVPKEERAQPARDSPSGVDEEYALMLHKLGYKDEALRVLSPSQIGKPFPPTREIRRKALNDTGTHNRGREWGILELPRWLYKRIVNFLIIAGNRSRQRRMMARRRARE